MQTSSTIESRNGQPKEGSTLYYSLLFTGPAARARVCQTLKLINAISTTLHDVSEPTIAEKKIHWWHEELARMATRSARHPDCVAVQDYLHRPDAVNAFVSILSAAANERYSPVATDSELHEMLTADYGARIKLVEKALVDNVRNEETHTITLHKHHANALHKHHANALHEQPDAAVDKQQETSLHKHHAVAFGLGQLHRLSTLALRLRHGYAVFSDEQYAQFDVTPEQLLNDQGKAKPLLSAAIEQSCKTLAQATEELGTNKSTAKAPLPIQIGTRLRLSQVNLWQKRKPDLLREYITVTPVRKFFIAYRCKRRFA